MLLRNQDPHVEFLVSLITDLIINPKGASRAILLECRRKAQSIEAVHLSSFPEEEDGDKTFLFESGSHGGQPLMSK